MSKNTELAKQMLDCYMTMDIDRLGTLLHERTRHWAPIGVDVIGRSRVIDFFRDDVFPKFRKVDMEIVNLYEDRTQPVVLLEWRGHLWRKNGNDYDQTGIFVIEVKDGKISLVKEYFDTATMNKNLEPRSTATTA
jgi:ketosteroid isomerase-like protein